MSQPDSTPAVALVILPFADVARAESFVHMLSATDSERRSAVVTLGTVFEWFSEEEGTSGQVLKFRSGWETFADPEDPNAIILQRDTTPKETDGG